MPHNIDGSISSTERNIILSHIVIVIDHSLPQIVSCFMVELCLYRLI